MLAGNNGTPAPICVGPKGTSHGPRYASRRCASTKANPILRLSGSAGRTLAGEKAAASAGMAQSRVQRHGGDIGEEIAENVDRSRNQNGGLDQGNVELHKRPNQKCTEARESEDLLHHDHAAKEVSEVQARDVDCRNQSVGQRMPPEDSPLWDAVQSGDAYIFGVERLDQTI